jgi:hypothetical protein
MVITKTVTVMTLMKTGKPEKISCRVAGGNGAFGNTADGGGVVIKNSEGAGAGVEGLGEDILVGNHTSELKVTDGKVTRRIGVGDEALLDVNREGGTPENRCGTIDEPDATHARLGGINGANAGREIRDNLSKLCGAKVQVGGECLKIIQLGTHMGVDADAATIRMTNSRLQCAEQPPTARDSKDHAAEFA